MKGKNESEERRDIPVKSAELLTVTPFARSRLALAPPSALMALALLFLGVGVTGVFSFSPSLLSSTLRFLEEDLGVLICWGAGVAEVC